MQDKKKKRTILQNNYVFIYNQINYVLFQKL